MTFIDLSSANPGATEKAPLLGAGQHLVSLSKLAYITSKDKALAVFENEDGEYLEWLGFGSDGAKKRSKAFLGHLANLAEVKTDLVFEDMAAFDAFGLELVEAVPDLAIHLCDDTYQGVTRAVLDGYFDKAIRPAMVAFDPTADGF